MHALLIINVLFRYKVEVLPSFYFFFSFGLFGIQGLSLHKGLYDLQWLFNINVVKNLLI